MNTSVGSFETQEERVLNQANPGSKRLFGENLNLDVTAKSNFATVRANTAVTKECYYYEVTLLSDGLMQIGWCQINSSFNHDDGVGDSDTSYAYDGFRCKKWHKSSTSYGEEWSIGDVIGTLINFKSREIMFWRNNSFLGVAFTEIEVG